MAAAERADDQDAAIANLTSLAKTISPHAGRSKEALRLLGLAEAKLSHQPDDPAATIRMLVARGRLQNQNGEREASLATLQRALVLVAEMDDPDPLLVANVRNAIGLTLYALGRRADSLEHYEINARLLREELGETHPRTTLSISNVGIVRGSMGDIEGGAEEIAYAIDLMRRTYGGPHDALAWAIGQRAWLLALLGRNREAAGSWQEAIGMYAATAGPADASYPRLVWGAAENLVRSKQPRAALDMLDALEASRASDPEFAKATYHFVCRATVLRAIGRLPEGYASATRAMELARAEGPEAPEVAEAAAALGGILLDMGRRDDARPHLETAVQKCAELEPPLACAEQWFDLARALMGQGRGRDPDRARELASRTIDLYRGRNLHPDRVHRIQVWLDSLPSD